MDNFLSSTYEDSKKILQGLRLLLERLGPELNLAGGVFGSLSRLELTPLSDIDLLCYCKSERFLDVEKHINKAIRSKNIKYSIDNIVLTKIDLVNEYALLNGTNYHSLYFLSNLSGDQKVVEIMRNFQEILYKNEKLRAREFINVISSFYNISFSIKNGDLRYLKFCVHGTNRWVRLAQLAQLRWPKMVGLNTKDIINKLAKHYNLPTTELIKEWKNLMLQRIRQEKFGIKNCYLPRESNNFSKLAEKFFCDSVLWIQSAAGVNPEKFNLLFKKVFNLNIPIQKPNKISRPINLFLKTVVSEDSKELFLISKKNWKNWWIATNIAANPYASPENLDYLVFPPVEPNTFLWRTVRLYAGKNQNTFIKTLKKILATKGLRDQDYEAAKYNLRNRGLDIK